ncbi:MAG TPA: BamA/TamA family outer membrane protein [Longimicrobiales bacterium]|nr:BamA/TamA family outer membrane protein [Longimicrobiales bacterium]
MHPTGAWCLRVAAALLISGAAGCAARGGGADAYPQLQPYAGREIEEVAFTGTLEPFDADTLGKLTETRATHCRLLGLPFCLPFTDIGRQEGALDLTRLQQDVERLVLFYRQNGFFGTRVEVDVDPADDATEDEGPVRVEFEVNRADPVVLRSLEIEGLEGVLDTASLPPLPSRVGSRFDLGDFLSSGDSVLSILRRRGHAYAEILRNYSVDTIDDVATASLQAIPGPVVRVDSIVIRGDDALGRSTVLRQLGIDQGELLRSRELEEGQRNLFLLELVQFASVGLAPDSLQLVPDDSTRATVLVQITEGPVHVVEAAVGWGSVSCFRTETSWVSRSLGGGARRLGLTARVSKIGLGGPKAGVAEGICKAFDEDPFGNELDYRFAADFTRPFFLNARNQLSANLFVERLSEPTVFQREARGGRSTLTRRFRNQDVATVSLGAERTRLDASPAIFCIALLVCQGDDIRELLAPRWRIGPEVSWARDRTDRPLNPSAGYQARTTGAWITPLLASDLSFVRLSGQGALYQEVRPGWIAAGQLRVGSFLGTAELGLTGEEDDVTERVIPPDERFFAGGASSVRGFEQNALGPGVWVDDDPEDETNPPEFVPVGGTSVVTASAELRLPSPVLREYLRAALFVDAGAVGALADLTAGLRVTPGAGVRIQTPVGPVRLDVAYNMAGASEGPLYVVSEEGDLIRVEDTFTRERGFWDRLQFHIAVGQAF